MNPNAPAFVPGGGGGPARSSTQPSRCPPARGHASADVDVVRREVAVGPDTSPQFREASRYPERLEFGELVATEGDLARMLDLLSRETSLSIDCEGADLSKGSWRDGRLVQSGPAARVPLHGQLCLIQIGTLAGDAFAVDVLELGARAFDLGLRRLLEDPKIVKVVFDFRQDLDALWHQHCVNVQCVFDCQLAEVLIRRLNGHRTGFVQGGAKLFAAYGLEAVTVPGYGPLTQELKLKIHALFSEDRHLWMRRPLPSDMVQYAKADVIPLGRLQLMLLRSLTSLVQDEDLAWRLVLAGSSIYDVSYAKLPVCRCRLCCNAADNAKFDGNAVFLALGPMLPRWLMQRLWRPEDAQPVDPPGPSRFYVNEHDESVPLPVEPG